jgi:hypothetical protein
VHLLLSRRGLGVGVLAVAMSTVAVALDTTPALPEGTAAKVIEADMAHLTKLFELAKTKKKLEGRVKSTALLIAAHAQSGLDGKDGAKMAGLRDQAVKVAEAAAKRDLAAAETAAKALGTTTGTAGKPMDLSKTARLDLHDIMDLFGGAGGGGMNLEKDIRAGKKEVTAANAEIIGARVIALADYTLNLPPDFGGKKTPELWKKWSLEMKQIATDVTVEAAKGPKADLAKLKKLMSGLDGNCTNCHNVFRED